MNRIIRYTQPGGTSLFPLFAGRRPWTGLEAEADRLFEAALADMATPAFAARFPSTCTRTRTTRTCVRRFPASPAMASPWRWLTAT